MVEIVIDGKILHGVQFVDDVGKSPVEGQFDLIRCINYQLLPIYLIQGKPSDVYTENVESLMFFRNLLAFDNYRSIGLLLSKNDENLVIYFDESVSIFKCIGIDFSLFDKPIVENKGTHFLETQKIKSDVLESKADVFEARYQMALEAKRKQSSSPKSSSTSLRPQVNAFIDSPRALQPETALSSTAINPKDTQKLDKTIENLINGEFRIKLNERNINQRDKYHSQLFKFTFNSTKFALNKFRMQKKAFTMNEIANIISQLMNVYCDIDQISTKAQSNDQV